MIYFFIIVLVVIADQFTKLAIQKNMGLGDSIPVVLDFFHFTFIHNYGAAFSFFQNQKVLLIFLPMLMILVLLGFMIYMRKRSHTLLMVSMSLIVAGGLGNLIDRLAYGYVVDFFDFRVFPIFNVADISVCCGCGLLLLYMFIVEPKLNREKIQNE